MFNKFNITKTNLWLSVKYIAPTVFFLICFTTDTSMKKFIFTLCFWLICVSFFNKLDCWKENLWATIKFIVPSMIVIYRITRYIGFENFLNGRSLCVGKSFDTYGYCIHFAPIVVYITGQILWYFETFPKNNQSLIPPIDNILIYFYHSIVIIGLIFGFIQNWTLKLQLSIDLVLIIAIIFFKNINITKWYFNINNA